LRSLTGSGRDRATMFALGAHDASRNRGDRLYVVLLDIGGQVFGGVKQSITNGYVRYSALVAALDAYVGGYHSRHDTRAPVIIALGTNNDLATSQVTGAEWAQRVVNPVRHWSAGLAGIQIVGANDLEPGFASGVGAARRWEDGYLHATSAPLFYNGSADGCSTVKLASGCNNGWSSADIARLAGLTAPGRIAVLPQIYNTTMAGQWAQIDRTAIAIGGHALRFEGPLTENAACGSDPTCPTMPSAAAWGALWTELRRNRSTAVGSLPAQTDLDVR
jgi:hypothetical protein